MAGIVHALVILGISFDVDISHSVSKALEIVLVQMPDNDRPDKADFLAQENQMGSGEAEEKAISQQQATPQPMKKSVPTESNKTQEAKAQAQKVLLQAQADVAIEASNKKVPKISKELTAADLLRQSEVIAKLQAEISEAITSYSRRPRKLHINSINAHKYKAASYEAAWQRKIERVGNLNYPSDVRRKKMSGTLVMSVELYADGNLKKIIVNRRSGHKIIDDAAINIVKLAAPFAPLPIDLQKEVDILVITRTWQFLNEGSLRTR
ncbi:MAG: energy transducer TonB [Cycloclasticus sp. symbiont of Bathymodiolus heckerae]|nr:MAG: energy transducer TonB [Cycloclasticus sp. symbiont of Bathymodiolus heckerae]